MENILQEIADDLDSLRHCLLRCDEYNGMGYIKNIGTNLSMLADCLGLDVDVRTPID